MPLLISDVFRRNAASAPNELAAAMDDRSLSHAQLDELGNRTAHALREMGIGRGDRVVTWTDTSLDVLPLFVACAKLGAVFAPLNARLGAEEASEVARMARPALLVSDAERVEPSQLVAKTAGGSPLARLGGSGAGVDLLAAAAAAPTDDVAEPALQESDTHVLFFTSGSTGRSKGVILSHRANYLRSFQGVFHDQPERTVCMFPLFHMAAFTLALAAWQTRGSIIFAQPATAEALLAVVERYRANRLYCIPAVWMRILDTDTSRYDLSTLEVADTGTSATPIELIEALKQRFPATRTRIFYGSTEAGSAAVLAEADVLRKPGSVGRAPAGVDMKLTDAGEICVRSDYLMDGYFENPDATAEALVDGWYHTGDVGALDDEGYLSVVGRVRDIIRSGGETVAPTEVESALAGHPAVEEVAVVGIPDVSWGEIVCAVVVPRQGSTPSLEDLQAYAAERLARFKLPRRLELIDALPRTAATRQVQRILIVEQILARG